jgi:serine/threonine protein phosphatase 1
MSHSDRRIVVGDIHGCIRTFRQLVEDTVKLNKTDFLFLTGDYIDRGPDSKAVTDYILWLQQESYNLVPLMGNHEYLLLHAMESKEYYKLWMLNSGYTTLNDFGIDVAKYPGSSAIKRIPSLYLEFFSNLRYYAETPGFFITHGCFDGRTENPRDDISSMIWRRSESYNAAFLNGRKLIHGHTPTPLEEIRRRVNDPASLIINLDAGCVYRSKSEFGYLAALDLDSWNLFALKNCE